MYLMLQNSCLGWQGNSVQTCTPSFHPEKDIEQLEVGRELRTHYHSTG